MLPNIYEDLNLAADARSSSGARQGNRERAERLVDINESVDVSTQDAGRTALTTANQRQSPSRPPAVHRKPLRAAALLLGLLCLLQLVGLAALRECYISLLEKHRLVTDSYEQLQTRYYSLFSGYCQLEDSMMSWRMFGCSCYYRSAGLRSWTESREDCRSRGADLVVINNKEEQKFLSELSQRGTSWIGLQSVKAGWEEIWRWEWVDTKTQFWPWPVGMSSVAVAEAKGYLDVEGLLRHASNGSRQWICEKHMM